MMTGIGPAGRIGQFFINSKLTPLLVVAALIVGIFAAVVTPREEEPQIVVPMVDIFVGFPGAGPAEVENRITIPLEKRMKEIPGVEYVYSASMPSVAMVTVRFLVNEDRELSLVKVYDKLAGGLDQMPEGATPPLVKSRAIDDVPILALTLWSDHLDGFGLRRVANELARQVSRLDNVAEIKVIGGQRRQLRIQLDAAKMAAFGVDPSGLVDALRYQNAAAPAGAFESGNREIKVETGGFLTGADEAGRLVVGAPGGRPVYLRDVAQIVDGPEDPADYVFFSPGPAASAKGMESGAPRNNQIPAVTLSIAKRQGSDAFKVAETVLAKVDELRGKVIPAGTEVTVTRNYGETAQEKVSELLLHLIIDILAVTVFIALTLGWRGATVVFVSVPVTFALTLFVYYVFGYTLNRVTLFALIFVTGIVVDDSIIIVENISRHFSIKKLPPLQAAITAINEVGNPTILATLTVIAALLPMAFVRGLMGPYMRPMPVGAALAMVFSLIVALVMAPWFAFRLLKGGHHEDDGGYAVDKLPIYRLYKMLLLPLMVSPQKRWAFLGGITLLLLLAVALFPLQGVVVKMLPFDNKSELQIVVDMPEGTTLETTARVARALGGYLVTVPEVTDLETYVGTAAPFNFNGLVRHYDMRRGSNVADLQVNFVSKKERRAQSHDLARRIRPQIEEIGRQFGAALKITEVPPGPPVLSTLVAEVYGPDQAGRLDLARRIKAIFEKATGVVDVDWFVEAPQEKQVFTVDREKAALSGVPAAMVARTMRLALTGEDAGRLHAEEAFEAVPIRLQLPRGERSSSADLGRVRIASMNGALVPLSELVRVEKQTEPVTRYRKNLKPVVYVVGEVAGRQESPVYAILDMKKQIAQLSTPGGATVEQFFRAEPWSQEQPAIKWDGEWHITYEVFRDLGLSFAIVLILIYLLIIAWFKSFSVPLTMMIAIPLALVGVIPGHWLFGAYFTATSMIGFIALAGVMVRNGVLLIDFVDLALERGRTLGEAVIEAGAVRTRPIVLTAGTVIVGAFVILFDPIFQGLAISLLAGGIASTVLTLGVVPVVHFMMERRRHPHPLPADWEKQRK